MSKIEQYLRDIMKAITGEELRNAIINAIVEINRIVEEKNG